MQADPRVVGIETRRIARAERFQSDLNILTQLLADEGHGTDYAKDAGANLMEEFSASTSEAQKELAARLATAVDAKLRRRLTSDLSYLDEIKRENGFTAVGAEEERAWRTLFTQASKKDKLMLVRDLRSELETTLVAHFGYYLSAWQDRLSEMDRPQEVIEKEVSALNEKFGNASDRGKVGIAKTLREKVIASAESSATARFEAFMEIYEELTRNKGLDGDDYPEAEGLRQTFLKANKARRTGLTNNLESLVFRAITAKPKNFPSA